MRQVAMTSALIGLVAGFFGGLVGIGGGVIMIPLMVRIFSFSQHQAHGTSMAALIFTGLAGALTYYMNGSVDLLAAALLAVSAMMTASLGAMFAHVLPEWRLKQAFGLFLVAVSLLLLLKPFYVQVGQPATGIVKVLILVASGAVSGFIAGLMGVGGGAVMVPAMVLFLGFNQHLAQGTSLLAMVPAGSSGALTHRRLGSVVITVVPGLILGIIVGASGGGEVAHMLPDSTLRLIFAAMLIWLGLQDINKARKLRASTAAMPRSLWRPGPAAGGRCR